MLNAGYGGYMELNVANDSVTRVGETPSMEAKVFVVDDDISVRESLEQLIRTEGWQPGTFASAEDFLSLPLHTGPCCIVLDMMLPGLSGLELQARLAEQSTMPIIFLTGRGDVPTTVQAMKAGAVEFLTKPFRSQALLTAIRGALDRSDAALREKADMRLLRTCYASLTPRQREVLMLVVSGLLNKQIAGELGISEITVKAHRGRLMRKMKADSVPDLVMMASTLGLSPGSRSRYADRLDAPKTPSLDADRSATPARSLPMCRRSRL
jgi:RNA polymerase sigma factor (sigma-70 family)